MRTHTLGKSIEVLHIDLRKEKLTPRSLGIEEQINSDHSIRAEEKYLL
jgi:hypothetical protein